MAPVIISNDMISRLAYGITMDSSNIATVGLGEAGETTSTGGGITQGVGKFIQGGGAGDSIVWVGDVGHFGVNEKEGKGDTHRVPATDHGEESEAIRRWDMGDSGGRRHARGIGNSVS